MHRGGGLVVCGTDAPIDNIGVSLHQNLRAMVAYGMTPCEALVTAMRNPARALAWPTSSAPSSPASSPTGTRQR